MNEGSEEFPHSIHENDMAKKKSVTVIILAVLTTAKAILLVKNTFTRKTW